MFLKPGNKMGNAFLGDYLQLPDICFIGLTYSNGFLLRINNTSEVKKNDLSRKNVTWFFNRSRYGAIFISFRFSLGY